MTPRKEAEELFRTFSQSASIGVYVIQNGRFRSANPQFVLATGYTEEELIGKEIYRTVLQHISKLNYQASVYTLTEDSRHLVIAASTIRPSILKPVEKLTGTTFKALYQAKHMGRNRVCSYS